MTATTAPTWVFIARVWMNNSTPISVRRKHGTKTDIRWWKQLNAGGNGLKVVGDAPFSASALHYTICSLDDGEQKDQRHSPEVQKADLTNLIIDKAQMGLGV